MVAQSGDKNPRFFSRNGKSKAFLPGTNNIITKKIKTHIFPYKLAAQKLEQDTREEPKPRFFLRNSVVEIPNPRHFYSVETIRSAGKQHSVLITRRVLS